MTRKNTVTCSDCGLTVTAAPSSPKWKGWHVILDYAGQFPPRGYRCPACYKALKKKK